MTLNKSIFALLIFTTSAAISGCLSGSGGGDDGGGLVGGPTSPPPPPPPPPPPSGNTPPVISGLPAPQVVVDGGYSFVPTASDVDGDRLTFSIANRPDWANFNAGNGGLTGSPTMGDIGIYDNITITVSDGLASASLAGFAVEVVATGSGSVTLTWMAPTENEDDTPLTDLAGYVIYYGVESGTYTEEIPVDNPTVTRFVVEGLTPNTYYFVATAKNSQGEESGFSNEAVKNVVAN